MSALITEKKSFSCILDKFSGFDIDRYLQNVTAEDVLESLNKTSLNHFDLLNFISDKAVPFLEAMAVKANMLTQRHFGNVVQIYSPLYLSDYCENSCSYCCFRKGINFKRKKLSFMEIEAEALALKKLKIEHVLILTGEAPGIAGFEYLLESVRILKKYFHSISIEVYPMETADYEYLKKAGVDGLTVYQEVYDREIYNDVHVSGRKKNFQFRMDAPERGASAGIRSINIGALLGLGNPLKEIFYTAMHAKYLSNKFPNTEFSISLPRINVVGTGFEKFAQSISDAYLVQSLIAIRLFLPWIGINISTRENAWMRENIVRLGVTKLSAGSSTSVGGYTKDEGNCQFDTSDKSSVDDVIQMLKRKNLQPVFKDWEQI